VAVTDGQLPEEPLTLEVELPWSDFASNLQVLGGYSSPSVLPRPIVTRAYLGALEARTLMRFDTFPGSVRVNQDGVIAPVDSINFVAGYLSIGFDTLLSVAPGPVALELGGTQEEWEIRTASWAFAVDTVGDQRAWTEAGAGPGSAPTVSSITWDPAVSDSVTFFLDSASISTWIDPSDQKRGGRLSTTTDGSLLVLNRAHLRLSIRAPAYDTIVEDTVDLLERTVLYDPPPSAPTGLRVGGVPAWRSLLQVSLPALTAPPELCAALGCPYTVDAGQISYAALKLTSQASEAAYQPFDTMLIDVRSVLSPTSLPKSPLGVSESGGLGQDLLPEAFGAAAGTVVELPITSFLRTLLGGPDANGKDPPSTLAVISALEPWSIPFASFDGPADPGAPRLRMILTVGAPQVLP